jgi:hypothetical protein
METFEEYLETIENPEQKKYMEEVLSWVENKFPRLEKRIAWSHPHFTDHGTYIISFSTSKKNLGVTPEAAGIRKFLDELDNKGYGYGSMTIKFPWDKPMDYDLLERMIQFNIEDKKECATYWRK